MTRDDDLIRDLFDELDAAERERLEEALAEDPTAREERARLRRVVETYRALGQEESPPPFRPPAPRGRSDARRTGRWLRLAALLALLVGAAWLGRDLLQRSTGRSGDPSARRAERGAPPPEAPRPSAAERIAALDPPRPVERPTEARLVEILRRDPSGNVRLAALDRLFEQPELAPPTAEIAGWMDDEPSAALRGVMVGWLAAARPEGWTDLLESVAATDRDPSVRRRASGFAAGGAT